jgi:multidrug resistance efflux pump
MKRQFALIAAVIILTAFIVSCGSVKASDANQQASPTIKDVAIVKVVRSSIDDFYEASGTVKAKTTTQVSANIMGRITSFPAAEGDAVARGQTLVEIDGSESRTQLLQAQANLEEAQASLIEVGRSVDAANAAVRTAEASRQLAEATFRRYKELYDRRSASEQEFDEARSRLSSATSELDRAKANVQTILAKNKQTIARIEQAKAEIERAKVYAGYSRIVSPVSGIVVKKFAESGATAAPGSPLLAIEDNSQYRLEAAVEESRSQFISVGNRVNVRIDAIGKGEFAGTIAEILPTSDAASRSYIVKIDLPANPQTAIVQRGQLTGVYVVGADGTLNFRIVKLGKTSETLVEVLSGVSEGEEIAGSDVEGLNDGTKVR